MTLEQLLHAGILTGLVLLLAAMAMLIMTARKIVQILQHDQATDLRFPFQQFALAVAQHDDLASVYYRGLQGFTGLSAEEQVRFFMIATLVFNYWNEVFEQDRLGIIPPANWERVQNVMRDFVRYPGIQQYWGYRRHWFSEDVQKITDALIRDSGTTTPSLYPEPSA